MDEKDQKILLDTFRTINTLSEEEAAQKLAGEIIALRQKLERAQDALLILHYYNRIHNDFEDYLFAVSNWGLGERDMPKVDDFAKGFTDTDVLVKMIRERRE